MNKPKICCAIVNDDIDAMKKIEPLVDLLEVRIDLIGTGWEKLADSIEKLWIATNRKSDEGGTWQGTEPARIDHLHRAVGLGAGMVDIELSTGNLNETVALFKEKVECIVSCHDTEQTSSLEKLKTIVDKQLEAGADICKVVTTAKQFEDTVRILQLIREYPENRLVAFAMGEAGQASRVLAPLAGGYFTFASATEGKESAPGQLTVRQLLDIYRTIDLEG